MKLIELSDLIPNKKSRGANRRVSRNKTPNNKSKSNVLKNIASTCHSGVPFARIVNVADYSSQPRSWALTQSPPRNVRTLIHWFAKTVTFVNGQSISTSVPVEYNYSFTIATVTPEYSVLTSLFDQYCIHSVIVHLNTTNMSTNSNTLGRVTTAIDYDNIANLGSEASVQEFASAQTCEVSPGLSIERAIMPTVDPQLYQVSSTGYGAARMWVDSASTAVQHYGFRSYWANNTVTALSFDLIVTSIIGFRNSI